MVSQAGTYADCYGVRSQTHIFKNGILGGKVEAGICLLFLQFGDGLYSVKRKTRCHRFLMKAGFLLLLFVLANLLYAVYRALKDTGFITSNPTSFERWINS